VICGTSPSHRHARGLQSLTRPLCFLSGYRRYRLINRYSRCIESQLVSRWKLHRLAKISQCSSSDWSTPRPFLQPFHSSLFNVCFARSKETRKASPFDCDPLPLRKSCNRSSPSFGNPCQRIRKGEIGGSSLSSKINPCRWMPYIHLSGIITFRIGVFGRKKMEIESGWDGGADIHYSILSTPSLSIS
jgi:hypothetical protein